MTGRNEAQFHMLSHLWDVKWLPKTTEPRGSGQWVAAVGADEGSVAKADRWHTDSAGSS